MGDTADSNPDLDTMRYNLTLADEVLALALQDRRAEVKQRVAEAFGDPRTEVGTIMLIWCDRVIEAHGGGEVLAQADDVAFYDVCASASSRIDEVPPAVAWVGRFLLARARDDEPAARALFEQLLALDPEIITDYVAMTLTMTVINIRHRFVGSD